MENEENVITPEVEQEETPTEEVDLEQKPQETISDIVAEPKDAPKETVGLDKFMSEKKARQSAEKKLHDLEESIKNGATKAEIGEEVDDLADEFGIDRDFLAKYTKRIKGDFQKEFDAVVNPMKQEKEKAKFEATFSEKMNSALENMPEYKNIVNPTVIKQLLLLRGEDGKLVNGSKTMEQLIEDTYVNSIGSKRTLETTVPRGGKEPQTVDFARAKKDTDYFKEIMANPDLKAKYNQNMLDNIR